MPLTSSLRMLLSDLTRLAGGASHRLLGTHTHPARRTPHADDYTGSFERRGRRLVWQATVGVGGHRIASLAGEAQPDSAAKTDLACVLGHLCARIDALEDAPSAQMPGSSPALGGPPPATSAAQPPR